MAYSLAQSSLIPEAELQVGHTDKSIKHFIAHLSYDVINDASYLSYPYDVRQKA